MSDGSPKVEGAGAGTGMGTPDRRGDMHRIKRLMDDGEARAFLRRQKVAHVGTVDGNGWPYVVPLIYIYEGGDSLFVHTGAHEGHFQSNVQAHPRLCVEAAEMGDVHRGHPYACNSALVYTSVIAFGEVRLIDDRERKTWFFDRVLEKYGESEWSFEPGYPYLDRIVLYEQRIEVLTGKHSAGLRH
jgi:nitroimidazol reductase NimA-like FMN-containing flavoprotein (pyridoxamine 5'-phosphate oxidase superfamily)